MSIQLGSREHYAIPRMLQGAGLLDRLVTDSWIPEGRQKWVAKASKSLALRRHSEIPDDSVRAATGARLALDVAMRVRGIRGWAAITRRNRWFQEFAARQVSRCGADASVCFSYSYTAGKPFEVARSRGLSCVLGQIDPGPLEYEVVDAGTQAYAHLKLASDDRPPPEYWTEWRDELNLADRILVNSEWSRELLVRQDVPEDRIEVVPLAYEAPVHSTSPPRERRAGEPLTVLFLGQVILRKGIGQLFDAIRLLKGDPVRFVIAGPVGVKIPEDIASRADVQFTGPVDGATARKLYRQADVFILPTLSDGFAITQLEALASRVPVIASKFCGNVVSHGENGLLLDDITPASIATTLASLTSGGLLSHLREHSAIPQQFHISAVAGLLAGGRTSRNS